VSKAYNAITHIKERKERYLFYFLKETLIFRFSNLELDALNPWGGGVKRM